MDVEKSQRLFCRVGCKVMNRKMDFVISVKEKREVRVLQLTDTQIIDSSQCRFNGRISLEAMQRWEKDQMENCLFKYIREAIRQANPDLILITGDIIYGEFDDSGTSLNAFIEHMDSYAIPWAPIYGNHDNETKKGAFWQNEQLLASKYCLFKKGDTDGNGNYTIGIEQGGNIIRVFYMLDSNGCSNPAISGDRTSYTTNPNKDNLGKVKTSAGFADDQVGWMSNSMEAIKKVSPDTKLSVACHIQPAYFVKAYEQYGYTPYLKEGSSSELKFALDLDGAKMINAETWLVEKELEVKEGDIGYLGRTMKGAWDTSYSIFSNMKQLTIHRCIPVVKKHPMSIFYKSQAD